jgi:hypothetical protein
MKKILTVLFTVGCLLLGTTTASAADTAPKSVIHIVTVGWKAGTTEAQIQAALDGAKALPAAYPGITRVWTRTIKAQNPKEVVVKKTHIIVMEFVDEAALKAYSGSDAQKAWYKLYLPIREQSSTHDVSN